MRASMAASRQSQLPGSVSSAAATLKLLEKKKEFEAVAALERASAQFLKRIEELGDDFEVMADAGMVHGQVLEQWPNMFRILSLFLSQREKLAEDENASSSANGERLVRVPLEELRQREPRT
ncbi:hypothetical protein BD309DRAFT_932901 [Dichomitus squalens]|uniref:DASH complex subunit DAD2 n=2 Tax=Dichomitus squalens TaxID=114155 RepID=A0A4Q9N9Z9_9APHY|nr:uncharacterized protein DICSQDRAFT_90981 [Dichomitus squalens LYAD-421 SS1]EJF58188.1 hypothetical protein DICSQDRAFT_90981 [Dichomitus squalens LYAD-421 SS1]TBU30201.1 hypothetical protein BD311DRAFT_691283 [Dichomitus squalens]TBU37078.1 hypothetical protein BD309DRAFT_932901 [Dichomitus squalens]TBU53790.1 hypothetical protein BD310DRAFT_937382 [Dichomitus squalens]